MRDRDARPWLAAVCWMGLITALSHGFVDSRAFVKGVAQSVPKLTTESSFSTFWSQWWWLFVKGWHVLEFFVLTVIVFRGLRPRFSHGASVGVTTTLCFAAAVLDEWHQTFVPYRGGHLSDVVIDSVGIVLASLWMSRNTKSARLIPA